MKPVFADTYYFLARLNRNDAGHERAAKLAGEMKNEVITTAWVMVEVADALSKDKATFKPFYDALRLHPLVHYIPATQEMMDKGIALYHRYRDKAWSLTDCISFVVMQDFGIIEALTADHHFEQAGFIALLK